MWLIQRGQWRNENTNKDGISLTGRDGLINLDYMGSAEFEFGTLAYSMYRIMLSYEQRKLFDSGIKTPKGLVLWIYCKESDYTNVLSEIRTFIDEPCPLKEWINLSDRIKEIKHSKYSSSDNFWWNVYKRDNTDWMAFIGAEDRRKSFLRVLEHDFLEWWMKMPDDEKAERLERMNHSPW